MLFITQHKLASLDKKIARSLRGSKYYIENKEKKFEELSINDIDRKERWVEQVQSFTEIVWKEKKFRDLIESYQINKLDLIEFYLIMTIATMPNPIFKTGRSKLTYTLTGSAMYQEFKKQLTACLQLLGTNRQDPEDLRLLGHMYSTDISIFARILRSAHENANGKITLEEAF